MSAPITSSVHAPGRGHLADSVWVFARPVDDEELVAAVRSAWEIEKQDSMLAVEDIRASWDPVRELFGNERYDETNYAMANWIEFKGRRFSGKYVSVAASRWRNGNREHGVDEGRTRLEIDCSDQDLAVAMRAAIAATSGPHDN